MINKIVAEIKNIIIKPTQNVIRVPLKFSLETLGQVVGSAALKRAKSNLERVLQDLTSISSSKDVIISLIKELL